jgi:hypothetical protein
MFYVKEMYIHFLCKYYYTIDSIRELGEVSLHTLCAKKHERFPAILHCSSCRHGAKVKTTT